MSCSLYDCFDCTILFPIFSLRYIAVTQPIKYAKHRNSRRVCLTIVLVWAISAAIGSPIVLGLNNTPDRDPNLCMFYNTDFIVYSSLSSFYIPCIIMVFLYWNIFKVRAPNNYYLYYFKLNNSHTKRGKEYFQRILSLLFTYLSNYFFFYPQFE